MSNIEPLGSIMAFQAQPYTKNQQGNFEGKTSSDDVSVNATQELLTEKNTSTVVETSKSDLKGNDNNSQQKSDGQNLVEVSEEERKKIMKFIKDANKKLGNTTAKFSVHEATNRIEIKLVDKTTNKVIKEIPPEKVLDNLARMMELSGLFMEERK